MNDLLERTVKDAAVAHGRDRHRLLDIVRDIQAKLGRVPGEAMGLIAHEVNAARVDVEGLVSFYAFLSTERGGRHVIRVTDCLAAKMRGAEQVVRAFEAELGIRCGETTEDGTITLLRTSCMGMCDQGPAALCDDIPITRLSTDRVRDVVRILRETGEPGRLVRKLGEGQNASDGIRAMVHNNIRRRGEVVFSPWESGAAIRNAVAMSPREVIRSVKTARLRGRGGAGFPTGMKWEFCRKAAEQRKIVICNADEGEPGTFKDRVILTECPDLFIEGMTVAGYAIGAAEGIIYLRGEYQYLAA